jgi:hypothetical protein
MPRTDTKNIKVGDWILIKTYNGITPCYWNQKGAMNHLCGTWQQVVLIDNFIRTKSDNVSVSRYHWSFKIEDVITYCTDEEYKKALKVINKPCDTSVPNHTFQPFEDAHNKAYDQLVEEYMKDVAYIYETVLPPEVVASLNAASLKSPFPITSDGWMPTNSFTKSTANLVATKSVKVTGYKYVNLKNK